MISVSNNSGSENLVGLAGTGYDSGVTVGQLEGLASLILLVLGWLFVPFALFDRLPVEIEPMSVS